MSQRHAELLITAAIIVSAYVMGAVLVSGKYPHGWLTTLGWPVYTAMMFPFPLLLVLPLIVVVFFSSLIRKTRAPYYCSLSLLCFGMVAWCNLTLQIHD